MTLGLLAMALLAWSSPALAQGMSNSGFGGTSSGNFGGTSSGGFGGSSSSGGFGGQSNSAFGSGAFGSSTSSSPGGSFSSGNAFGSGTFGTTTGTTTGTSTGIGTGVGGTTTYSVSPSNLLGAYYGNPTGLGAPGTTTTTARFGQPVYNLTTSTTGSTTSGITGSFGSSSTGMQGGVSPQSSSFTPVSGQLPVTYYVATLGLPHGPTITSGKVLGEVRGVIARSSSLPSKDKIRVLMAGDTVILQGSVSDEHERRLAAALVSLTPGVHGVSNELKVQGRPFMPTLP